jgi:hypothetical protein
MCERERESKREGEQERGRERKRERMQTNCEATTISQHHICGKKQWGFHPALDLARDYPYK